MYFPCLSSKCNEDKYKAMAISVISEISDYLVYLENLVTCKIPSNRRFSLDMLDVLTDYINLAEEVLDGVIEWNKQYALESNSECNSAYTSVNQALLTVRNFNILDKEGLKSALNILIKIGRVNKYG